MATRLLFSAALIAVVCGPRLAAEEPGTTVPPAAALPPTAAVPPAAAGQPVANLDAAEFAQRQEASQRLLEAGQAAFPELEKSAAQGSREASGRALEIFERHFQRGDDATRQAARESLERLALCGNPAAAQRASSILNPPPAEVAQPIRGFGVMPAIQRANIQIQIAANIGNGNARRMQVRNENGKRTIELEENGKKTKVQDGANGGIEVEITQKVNGKETTEKFQAKDLDDLQKKNGEVARLYAGAVQNGRGIRMQAGQPVNRPFPAQPGQPPQEVVEQIVKSLDGRINRLERLAPGDPNLQRDLDNLKQRKQQYEQMLPAPKPADAAPPAEPAPPPQQPAANN